MSALPPDDVRSLRQTAFAARHSIDSMIAQWHANHSSAAALARLAGLGETDRLAGNDDFSGALEAACDWQRELAWQATEDIAVMLQSGMAALDVLVERGKEARIPALALWREVDAAQRSVLEMLDVLRKAEITPAS